MKKYDVIIIGAGPGGIFATYELSKKMPNLSIAVFEAGHKLSGRKCPIDGDKIPNCIQCKSCSIMSGFGGLIEGRHRALVFSQFTSHLALIRAKLDELGIQYLYLDGSTPAGRKS